MSDLVDASVMSRPREHARCLIGERLTELERVVARDNPDRRRILHGQRGTEISVWLTRAQAVLCSQPIVDAGEPGAEIEIGTEGGTQSGKRVRLALIGVECVPRCNADRGEVVEAEG